MMVGRKPKLTRERALEVRIMYTAWSQPTPPREIARMYGITGKMVTDIGRGRYQPKNHRYA